MAIADSRVPYLSMADPDAAQSKRARLDTGNLDHPPVYTAHALPPPPPPHHTQPTRPPSHPTLVQASSSPPSSNHYSVHTLPAPSPQYTHHGQGFPGPLPSPSLPPSDIRAFADPRNIPSPRQHTHGVSAASPVTIPQDRISSYRPAPPTPQSTAVPVPHRSRSTSVSISVDIKPQPQPPMEHGGHQPPWPMNHEHHRSNGSIPNGYSHSMSPSHPNGPSFHASVPPPSQPYAQPGTPYAQTPYMNDYGAAAQQMRRKQVRATQACNHCRSRKQKCDEARPCQFCRENNYDCQYKDVPPPKQDRSMMQLQDSVSSLQDSVNSINNVISRFVDRFEKWQESVESRLPPVSNHGIPVNHASPEAAFSAPTREQSNSRWPTPIQGRSQAYSVNGHMKMESPSVAHPNMMSPLGAQGSAPIKQESMFVPPPPQPMTPADSVRTDRSRTAENSSKESVGLQSDHSTPAHKLLEEWPNMNLFYKDIHYFKKLIDNGRLVSDYPLQLEQDRGLLRVWGVGEGYDLNDGTQGPGSPESSNDSETTSPAPGKDGLWGHPPFDQPSPFSEPSATPREYPTETYDYGLGRDGRPDFRRHVLFDLLKSYMETMHTFHPFMNESKLKRMFREFSDQYSPDVRTTSARSPAAGLHQLNHSLKRKRSTNGYDWTGPPRGEIERSLRNAIVLLVMALGKVCSHTARLPAPQSDRGSYDDNWGSPNASFNSEGSNDGRPRNIDILPGMAYYAYATDILGNQQGGNTTAHAQANLLAALYVSQFARVLESWSWINNACRIILILIKADYSKLRRDNNDQRRLWTSKERYRLNLVLCVYWTALQLESDILAEMSTLPPSGISAHQNDITYPEGVNETWPDQENNFAQQADLVNVSKNNMVMHNYSTQTFLRVVLNAAHNALYGPTGRMTFDPNNIKEVADTAETHSLILKRWRNMLSPELAWKDEELPSTDINIARVRAKYYGGFYMILRPYLKLASHYVEYPPPPPGTTGASQQNSDTDHGNSASSGRYVQMVELTEQQQRIIDIACKCIDSAIQSTIAFDRVGEEPGDTYNYFTPTRKKRLIVTNVFGTLHAQFGNMLVLASVFNSKLYPLLPKDTWLTKANLAALFKRTIDVLGEVADNSPILRVDLEILRNVQRQFGFE
ncbi:hypothetical protein BDW02DRAFT_571770 [Decorospora gaudefroyi]|uniref:Zn(2)-C6 fungal-type domain-containing protein n=1 Tax=Decorospora gaudefroyi TaxID=184978 RepID=A0A6A5K220_9PLEO|nr:hypothetical protein BDW02DRAFT_571770 [Decorospora gaudefroyi]